MISLFTHNQTAYDATEAMLAETGKAAVIHPTGTGKSMIAFKMCEKRKGEKVLWLGPSSYIYKTQVENLRKVTSDDVLRNVTFHTYAKLMMLTESEMKALKPSLIILDEFHRAGAAGWGEGVLRLLDMYPDVPLTGFSATNIRYLDGQRDMADELFDGHIASEISLGEAIVRGILKQPRYICSVYSYNKSLERYKSRIRQAKSRAVRDSAEELLDQLRRALEKADGLEDVFYKNMTEPHGKYLVFCSDKEHMDDMVHMSHEWFAKVDENPHIYTVYSEDPETDQAFKDFKEDSSDHLRLLLCIDMLNEGIHVADIDGVILLRPTISPIVYKQQIGRALSAGSGKEAVIFDIVLNIEKLISIDSIEEEMQSAVAYYRSIGREEEIVTEHFKISGQLRDCMELFTRLDDTLGASWELMYMEAKKYYETYGNLNVPKWYVSESGYSLGSWLMTQRRVYAGSKDGLLDEDRIRLLSEIGMRWESASDANWEMYLKALADYKEQFGDLRVPARYKTENGLSLGSWVSNLRTWKKAGVRVGALTEDREKTLDEMGMVWDIPDYTFERNYAAALEYFKENGDLNVPAQYVTPDGVRLGAWISLLRSRYKKGKLTLDDRQKQRLEKIGMQWGTKYENAWESAYQEAALYCERHGDLDIPTVYVTETGLKLGRWIRRQRDAAKSGKLSEDRMKKLDDIDLKWKVGA